MDITGIVLQIFPSVLVLSNLSNRKKKGGNGSVDFIVS